MSDLVRLLEKLGSDAELESEFQRDPEAVLDRFDLDSEERKAMLEGDQDAVSKLTGLTSIYMTNSTIKAPGK